MRTILKSALVIFAVFFACPVASAEISNPDEMIYDFDVGTIQSLLTEKGLSAEIFYPESGTSYISGVDPASGLTYYLMPSCDDIACVGLEMIVTITNDYASYEKVNTVNGQFVFLDVYRNSDGLVYATRYEVCDYGISRGNLDLSIGLLLRLSAKVDNQLAE